MPHENKLEIPSHPPEEAPLCCLSTTHLGNRCWPCANVAAAEQRVRDASDALELALRGQSETRNQRNAHHSQFSRLPTEIACRIFSLCFPAVPTPDSFYWAEHFHHYQEDDAQYPQLMLGAVCHNWRRIIWSNPSFWRFIFLKVTTLTSADHSIVAREWLNRSGSLPLVIHLSVEGNPGGNHIYRSMDSLVDALNDVADRWHCIGFNIPSAYIKKLSAKPSQIEALILYPSDKTTSAFMDIRPHLTFDLGNAPSPSYLKVRGCRMRDLHVLWHNVIEFDGIDISTADCLKVLRCSPRLEKCDVYLIDNERSSSVLSALVHDSLRILKIERAIESFSSRMTCPSLQKLDLIFYSGGHELRSQVVHQFLIRSTRSLVSLSLIDMEEVKDEDLIRILSLIPSLEELVLSSAIGPNLFERLGQSAFVQDRNRQPQLLPNLRSFTYVGYRGFSWSSIAAMVPLDPPSPAHTVRRPLSDIKITIYYFLFDAEEGRTEDDAIRAEMIDRFDLQKMVDIQQKGINLSLTADNGTDVLKFWMNIYGMDKRISATGSKS